MTTQNQTYIRVSLLLFFLMCGLVCFVSFKDNRRQYETCELEKRLLKMTGDQLFKVGITQVEQPGPIGWSVAWSDNSNETCKAIFDVLELQQIGAVVSCGHGRAGWYVASEDFFRARKALLNSATVYQRDVTVVTPRLEQP